MNTNMDRQNASKSRHAYRSGMIAFFLSGICSIASGIIVSLLRDRYQFSFSFSGTLVSVMSIGNMAALLLAGILPGMIGEKATTLILTMGACLGYMITAMTGNPMFLAAAFLIIGLAKGCAANKCTVLVGNNTDDKPRALSLMNAWFALGALLCPFLIASLQGMGQSMPMFSVSFAGLCMWVVFLFSGLPGKQPMVPGETRKTDYTFLKSHVFWLLALLLFCENAAEYVVNGWVVTYYKNEQILSGTLATYTVTVQWASTLVARLLLAFLMRNRNPFKALVVMGIGMTLAYGGLLVAGTAVPALIALALFSISVAGAYPMGVASVGEMLSSASVGILLAFAGVGGIVFPWLVGIIADAAGLRAGMAVNLIPCVGLTVLSLVLLTHRKKEENAGA
ncbi:MAG: MFS transporter [Clostridia bacterium]|nr:MFS transporter [Clostridia bacterium]